MMKLTSITGLLGLSAVLLSLHLPAAAQNCRPLSLLGGEGSEVTKSVSQPVIIGIPIGQFRGVEVFRGLSLRFLSPGLPPSISGCFSSIAIKLTRNFLILMEYESNPINP
jgi:hypothetical protein